MGNHKLRFARLLDRFKFLIACVAQKNHRRLLDQHAAPVVPARLCSLIEVLDFLAQGVEVSVAPPGAAVAESIQ